MRYSKKQLSMMKNANRLLMSIDRTKNAQDVISVILNHHNALDMPRGRYDALISPRKENKMPTKKRNPKGPFVDVATKVNCPGYFQQWVKNLTPGRSTKYTIQEFIEMSQECDLELQPAGNKHVMQDQKEQIAKFRAKIETMHTEIRVLREVVESFTNGRPLRNQRW